MMIKYYKNKKEVNLKRGKREKGAAGCQVGDAIGRGGGFKNI